MGVTMGGGCLRSGQVRPRLVHPWPHGAAPLHAPLAQHGQHLLLPHTGPLQLHNPHVCTLDLQCYECCETGWHRETSVKLPRFTDAWVDAARFRVWFVAKLCK